jgi:predicted DNA-binding transcriptional regulator
MAIKGNDIRNKGVVIVLDKERHLKYDLNAFCELEDRFGDIQTAFDSLEKGSMKSIRSLLSVGLIHEDELLTDKEIGSFVGMNDLEEIAEKIGEAITGAMPDIDSDIIEKN